MATPTHAALMAPRLSLASCVRAYVTRSTVGADLPPAQRFNYFPASPLFSITWLLEGESQVVGRGEDRISEWLPTLSFIGSHTVPVVSFNPGAVRSFMLMLVPEATRALTGVDLATYVNRVVPLAEVLDGAWLAMAQAVMAAPDDATRVQVVEAFLEPRWAALRLETMPSALRSRYWVEGMALRAANSGVGKSLRQAERRVKQWAGLSLRDLRRLARGEDSFYEARAASEAAVLNWAHIAADLGYSDQAHLCRETRRITGLSPTELKKAVETADENYWVYRLIE